MNKEIEKILNAIKINVEIAKINNKPIFAEVSMDDKSKEYIGNLILEYGNKCYNKGSKKSISIDKINEWKFVKDENPPVNIDLLVQCPLGVNHIASWIPSYNIFTCQDKKKSSFYWKWKLI